MGEKLKIFFSFLIKIARGMGEEEEYHGLVGIRWSEIGINKRKQNKILNQIKIR